MQELINKTETAFPMRYRESGFVVTNSTLASENLPKRWRKIEKEVFQGKKPQENQSPQKSLNDFFNYFSKND